MPPGLAGFLAALISALGYWVIRLMLLHSAYSSRVAGGDTRSARKGLGAAPARIAATRGCAAAILWLSESRAKRQQLREHAPHNKARNKAGSLTPPPLGPGNRPRG